MNESLEKLKSEQTRIDLLKLQKEMAESDASKWCRMYHAEKTAYNAMRTSVKALVFLIVILTGFIILLIGQQAQARKEKEMMEQQSIIPQRNDIKASESFAAKYINQADSVFDGLLMTDLDTAQMVVPGNKGKFFRLLIIKSDK